MKRVQEDVGEGQERRGKKDKSETSRRQARKKVELRIVIKDKKGKGR